MSERVCKHCGEKKEMHQKETMLCPVFHVNGFNEENSGPTKWEPEEKEEEMSEDIKSMKLHETLKAGDYVIFRVDGGWIYTDTIRGGSVFVPELDNKKQDSWEFLEDSGTIECGSCGKEFYMERDYEVAYFTKKLEEGEQ